MNGTRLDRRVKYTYKSLKDAMIDLLHGEHISKISVVSLCDRADINRSTFYNHFKDQYDLLDHITLEALGNIKENIEKLNHSDNEISIETLQKILDYVKANTGVFKALLSDNCDPDIQREVMRMIDIVSINDYQNLSGRKKDYMMLFQITGCISMLNKWLMDGTPESTYEMSCLIVKALGRQEMYDMQGLGRQLL